MDCLGDCQGEQNSVAAPGNQPLIGADTSIVMATIQPYSMSTWLSGSFSWQDLILYFGWHFTSNYKYNFSHLIP